MIENHLKYWSLKPELALLLDIVLRKNPRIPEGINWADFEALLRQHRLQPLLIRGLRGMDTAHYPVLEKYRGMQNKYATESLHRLQALAEANGTLAEAGIRMIAMKGPLLAMELYGDPSLRTSRDLDVMVAQKDLDRAEEILLRLGYVPEENPFHKTPLRRKYYSRIEPEKHRVYNLGDICLELHWRGSFQKEDSFDALWERREEQPIFGRKIAIMGTADRYPALIIHAAEHGFHRLRWLLDLYELQKKPSFSWETVYAQLSDQGLGALLLETMLVMHRLRLPGLEDVVFGGIRLTHQADGLCLALREELCKEGKLALQLTEAVYPMWQSEAVWADPRHRIYDKLLPTSLIQKSLLQKFLINFGPSVYDLELIDLPDWLFWLYFIIRPFHWLQRKLTGK